MAPEIWKGEQRLLIEKKREGDATESGQFLWYVTAMHSALIQYVVNMTASVNLVADYFLFVTTYYTCCVCHNVKGI